jgi:predicted porin
MTPRFRHIAMAAVMATCAGMTAPVAAQSIVYLPPSGNSPSPSGVELFGRIDTSVQFGNAGGKSITQLDSSNVTPSVWGLAGNEDLGGGYRALFKLEDGFNPTSGTIAGSGALFGRESWVGLAGPFGQAQVGVNYTPIFTTLVTYSQGQLWTLGWGNAANNFFYLPSARTSNSVRYVSPSLAGLQLRASYARGANGTAGEPTTLGDTASVGLVYKVADLSADIDYLQQAAAQSTPVNAATTTKTGSYWLAGASYDFGWIKPAVLGQIHRSGTGSIANTTTFQNPDNDFYELSVLIRSFGTGTLLVDFGQYRQIGFSNGDATSYALRYDYPLSARTGLYAGVGHVRNGSAASFSMSTAQGPGLPTTPGHSVTSGVIGMLTKF